MMSLLYLALFYSGKGGWPCLGRRSQSLLLSALKDLELGQREGQLNFLSIPVFKTAQKFQSMKVKRF